MAASSRERYGSVGGSLTEAKGIAAGLPDLLVEARRVASTVLAGWHGRRVAGPGETFWQYRPFTPGEAAATVDWRRSARPGQGNAETDKHVAWGPGPRASQALTLCARARALYDGRLAPSVDDIRALAEPVLQHRMALGFAARADGMSVRDVIAGLRSRLG